MSTECEYRVLAQSMSTEYRVQSMSTVYNDHMQAQQHLKQFHYSREYVEGAGGGRDVNVTSGADRGVDRGREIQKARDTDPTFKNGRFALSQHVAGGVGDVAALGALVRPVGEGANEEAEGKGPGAEEEVGGREKGE
jgi:hypothetical protein